MNAADAHWRNHRICRISLQQLQLTLSLATSPKVHWFVQHTFIKGLSCRLHKPRKKRHIHSQCFALPSTQQTNMAPLSSLLLCLHQPPSGMPLFDFHSYWAMFAFDFRGVPPAHQAQWGREPDPQLWGHPHGDLLLQWLPGARWLVLVVAPSDTAELITAAHTFHAPSQACGSGHAVRSACWPPPRSSGSQCLLWGACLEHASLPCLLPKLAGSLLCFYNSLCLLLSTLITLQLKWLTFYPFTPQTLLRDC